MREHSGWLNQAAFGLLALLVFTVPFQDVLVVGDSGTFSRLLGYVTLAVAAVAILSAGRFQSLRGPALWAFAYLAWSMLSLAWSVSEESTLEQIPILARNLGLFWLLYEYVTSVDRSRTIELAYVLGCFICIVGVFHAFQTGEVVGGPESGEDRYAMGAKDPNDAACLLAVGIPISFYLQSVTRSGAVAWFSRLYVPLAVLAVLLTGSRGGLLATLVGLLTLCAYFTPRKFGTVVVVGLLLALLLFATWQMLPESNLERFRGIPDEIAAGTMANRRFIWQAGLEIIPDHFVLGVGAGAFGPAMLQRGGFSAPMVAHNTLLGTLVDLGTVGFILFTAILVSIGLRGRRLPPAEKRLTWSVLLTWLVGSSGISWEGNKTTWFVFGLLAAAAVRAATPAAAADALELSGRKPAEDEPAAEAS